MTPLHADLSRVRDTLLQGHSFLLTSHAHPDGDSLGSQLALAGALQQLGKQVRIINSDPAPALYAFLPGMSTIEIAAAVEDRGMQPDVVAGTATAGIPHATLLAERLTLPLAEVPAPEGRAGAPGPGPGPGPPGASDGDDDDYD